MQALRTLGKAVALGAAAFLASWMPANVQAADAPGEEDFVLLEMQVKNYRLMNELRGYQTADGSVCVDLADTILALDLPVRLDKKSRRATGWLFRESQTITIDRDQNSVQIMNESRALLPGEIVDTPEGWCVDVKSLGGWLGVTLTPDLFQSVLRLESEKPLPFLEAIERKSRAARLRGDAGFDLAAYPQAKTPYKAWRAPSVDVVARTAVGGGHGPARADLRYEVFASGEIAQASFDARLASDSDGVPESLRVRAYRNDPQGGLLGPLRATQVAAGDVELLSGNLAGSPGVGRGAFVSNRPLQRPTRFGTTVLRGTLPLGWDAELYRNGQLLAFQSETSDGRYEFEVSLVYGRNDLEVVLYGPQGQIRRESQSVPVGLGAVEAGKFEYWAGAIQQNRDLIAFHRPAGAADRGWQYGLGMQYGLDTFTAIGANAHSLNLEGRRRHYAELGLQRALGRMVVNLTAAQELRRGRAFRAQALGQFGRINLEAESFLTDGSFVSGIVGSQEKAAHSVWLETSLLSGRPFVPVAAGFRRTERRNGQMVNEWLARASLILPRMSLTANVTRRQVYGPLPEDDGGTIVGLLANTRLLDLTVRADARYRLSGADAGLEQARLTVEKALDERSDLRFEAEYDARSGVADFQAGYVRQFRKFALTASGTANDKGGFGANLAVNFSFSPDPFGRGLRFSSEKLARRGQAAVTVFLDENGDGLRSPGEEALSEVGITAGHFASAEPTDADGQTVLEGLNPYDPVLVSVDESTLPDPFLVPVGKGLVITPRPGIAAELQIAVAPTGEIEGIVHGPDGTPRPGVELELVDRAGLVAARTHSEYDGFFLFDRVAYGSYRLRLGADSARVLGAARDLGRSATLSSDATLVQLGVMRLQASAIAGLEGGGVPPGSAP